MVDQFGVVGELHDLAAARAWERLRTVLVEAHLVRSTFAVTHREDGVGRVRAVTA